MPAVLHHDEALALIVMELLEPHIILRKGLIAGNALSALRRGHHDLHGTNPVLHLRSRAAGGAEEAGIAAFRRQHALCRITEDLIFTDPYRMAELNRWTSPWLDDIADKPSRGRGLQVAVSRLKLKFMSQAEALIHGDLHTGSIMVTESETRVIDPEFAFYGPMGFDVGAVLANLLMAYLASAGHERTPGERQAFEGWVLETVEKRLDGVRPQVPRALARGRHGRCLSGGALCRRDRARRAWRPSGRPTCSGCSPTPSASPRRKSCAVSSASPTTSTSS